jgi:hypothetical protein
MFNQLQALLRQNIIHILSRVGVTVGGVWFDGVIAHLYTRLGTTNNYSAIAELHNLQLTREHAKSSQSAFTSRFLVTDLNNGDSSASVVMPWPAD